MSLSSWVETFSRRAWPFFAFRVVCSYKKSLILNSAPVADQLNDYHYIATAHKSDLSVINVSIVWSVARQLPLIGAILCGQTHFTSREMRHTNRFLLFTHILGFLELLQPHVFSQEYTGLTEILDSFFSLLQVCPLSFHDWCCPDISICSYHMNLNLTDWCFPDIVFAVATWVSVNIKQCIVGVWFSDMGCYYKHNTMHCWGQMCRHGRLLQT